MEKSFGTLSQTIEGLKKEGYTMDFNISQECLTCHKSNTVLSPDEFEIDSVYRFEGDSNPDDEAVVYAISSSKYGVKGTLVNAYGPYADEASDALVQKLHQRCQISKVDADAKPIKRSKHILRLSKDHHFTLLFCWKIRQGLKRGVAVNRIKKYVEYFWQKDMQDHFREEEEILFTMVKDAKVQKAMEDHKRIEEGIELLKTINEERAQEQLRSLADAVDAHVRYEERELFPHLEKVLTEAQLEAIGNRLKEEALVRDEYADEFWLKEK
ncbi:MAG TPA: hemerythrin domain-containing protein [Flavisolibacter sp.]|jgi:hemerythrin superfamily protein